MAERLRKFLGWSAGFVAGIAFVLACELSQGPTVTDVQAQEAVPVGPCAQWQWGFVFGSDADRPESPATIPEGWEPFGYQQNAGLHYVALRRCIEANPTATP